MQKVPIFSANCAGCENKIQSLVNNVNHIGAGIFTLQETHFKRKGRLNSKFCEFQMFEAIRKKQKGGSLIGVHKNLDPILIEEYSEDFELLVVEAKLGNKDVRIISGYGPQENWKIEERMPFFRALEEEILKAKLLNKSIYIQMDANSKLGPEIVSGDPHEQSENGKILIGIIKRNALIVMNSSTEKCKGRITRRRITKKVKEESIIDFVIVSEDMEDVIEDVVIDEERKFVLSRHTKTKKGSKTKESDHNSIITNIKGDWTKKRSNKRIEMYNIKDKEGLKKFKAMTEHDEILSKAFQDNTKDLNTKTKAFLKKLNYCLSVCFQKIRIKGTKRNQALEELFNKRRILRNKKDEESIEKLKEVENKLAEICAEDNVKIIKESCKGLTCEDGGLNAGRLWQLKRKLRGIYNDPPTAMYDEKGNLVTSNKAIEELTIKMYEDRLKALKIKDELKLHKLQRENLFDERIEEAQQRITPDWTMTDLEVVLNQLKKNKSRDPLGLSNELFKPQNSGKDLRKSILMLMNQIKTHQTVPDILKLCNITSLYKNKGSRKNFTNYRGIFRVTILRSILDKLIYNDEYEQIDQELSDSNVGARKNRNIRDNIFVINAIVNNVRKRNLKGIDVTVYDVEKCFDKLWAKECLNDIYECGFQNDKLPLLYHENTNAKVAIKTSSGITRRIDISEIIMQGTVWGSLLCTGTMDKLGKMCYEKPEFLYKYKGVPIPPLGMVDDVINVSNVENAELMNQVINTFIESKKLKLAEDKCARIHIGKGHEDCPELKVHEAKMKDSDKEKYLGDIIDKTGSIQATIDHRKKKGDGIIAEILSIISEIPLGKHKIEVALTLREAMLINGILYNSEAWHGVTNAQIVRLEAIDEALLRGILKAHMKTPKEFLYLETGALPIRWILAQRRINYLQQILNRNENELVKKVFLAQNENPTSGDFVKLVKKDLTNLGMKYEDILASNVKKAYLKTSVRNVAFKELMSKLNEHTKVKHIRYEKFEMQQYLAEDSLSRDEASMLTALRSHCVRGIKMNFKKMFKMCLKCPLQCDSETPQDDTQDHILKCKLLENHLGGNINHITGNIDEQTQIAKIITKLMRKRTHLLEQIEDSTSGIPGAPLDQSTPSGAAIVP